MEGTILSGRAKRFGGRRQLQNSLADLSWRMALWIVCHSSNLIDGPVQQCISSSVCLDTHASRASSDAESPPFIFVLGIFIHIASQMTTDILNHWGGNDPGFLQGQDFL
jgi:hypothetical protein